VNGLLSQIVAFGVAAGLSPVPIIGVVVMLGTPRAKVNSLAFATSWLVSIFVVGTAATLASSGTGATAASGGSGVVVWQVVLGVLLVLLGLRHWRGRPRDGTQAEMPKWLSTTDQFDAARSAAMGFALSVINPKNLLLVLSAAGAASAADVSTGDQILAIALFTVIATLGVAAPIAIYFALGERSVAVLAKLRRRLIDSNATIMAVICVLLGVYLLAKGLAG
jgi:cytochrome c biogenesis protein CcdA